MFPRVTTVLLLASATTDALLAPVRRASMVTHRFSEVVDRVEESVEITAAADSESPVEVSSAMESVEITSADDTAAIEINSVMDTASEETASSDSIVEVVYEKPDIYTPLYGKKAVAKEIALTAPVSDLDEFLIKWGFKEDPRVPEDERVDQMTRIKNSGKAGIAAYAITEGAFWIGSVPFAIAAVTLATGSFPDINSVEGKEAIAADVFVFINFARLIVPARIALALALAPWCDENIIQKFFPAGDAADSEN